MTFTNPDPSLPTLAPTTENTVLNWFVGMCVDMLRNLQNQMVSAKPNSQVEISQLSSLHFTFPGPQSFGTCVWVGLSLSIMF